MIIGNIIFMGDIHMRRWRRPPNICTKACNNIGKSKNSNYKNKIEYKINKHPVSNGIRAKNKLPNLPKRNRVLFILSRMGARPPPCLKHIPTVMNRGE